MKFLIVNGVNLALTGLREPEIYGTKTLDEINQELAAFLNSQGHQAEFFQSDIEGELCAKISRARDFDGIVLNPGAYAHYSYALRDAIAATKVPVVEVHMSNLFSREEFRAKSVLSAVCKGVIVGFGDLGYQLALMSFLQ